MSDSALQTFKTVRGENISARSVAQARAAARITGQKLLMDADRLEQDAYKARFGKHYPPAKA